MEASWGLLCRTYPGVDPTLLKLMRSLRNGKRVLMDLARHAAIRNMVLVRLVEKWDALSSSAQTAVTLTDLCKFSNVTPARFIAAVSRAGCEIGNMSVVGGALLYGSSSRSGTLLSRKLN